MEAGFWHERWEKGEIGFHQNEFNRHMQAFVGRLGIGPGAQVLVPLCGKSLDMLWLAQRGYRVLGVEISERAVRDFFTGNRLDYELDRKPGVTAYRGEAVKILCTDFFTLDKTDLPRIDAVYDRASLVALPADMRPSYAERLSRLLERGTRSLLITLDYARDEMTGPPFSVTSGEIARLFGAQFSIERLHSEDCLAREPRFRKKGLTRLEEHVFLLQKCDDRPAGRK